MPNESAAVNKEFSFLNSVLANIVSEWKCNGHVGHDKKALAVSCSTVVKTMAIERKNERKKEGKKKRMKKKK